MDRVPFPVLQSEVRDVVYASWIVPAAAARPLVPPGVDLVERDGRIILTVLTYRHGHFGPVLAGPLRRLFPSPLQSNWRFYVDRLHGTPPAVSTVLFISNVFSSALYALGTRLLSDALPSHLAARFEHRCDGESCAIFLAEGGSAPGLELSARVLNERTLPTPFAAFFHSWEEAAATLATQDAAVAAVPDSLALAEARIALPIALDQIVPLVSDRYTPGRLLSMMGAHGPPFCFLVPSVTFQVVSEQLLPDPAGLATARARP